MKAVGVFATAAGIAISQACAAEIPLHSQHYSNTDYRFSVNIPTRLTACVSEGTNNGVAISLDHETGCDKITNNPPFATVFANYNVATGVKTQEGLAKLNCYGPEVRRTTLLNNWTIGGRPAGGCRLYLDQNEIEVKLMTLRKTDTQNPEAWIEIGAYLSTTTARYERDMRVFRQIVRTIRIAPDGPLE